MQLNIYIGKSYFLLLIVFSFSCGNETINQDNKPPDFIIGSWKANVVDVKHIHSVIKTDTLSIVPSYFINPKFNLIINTENNYQLISNGEKSLTGKYIFVNDTLELYEKETSILIAKVDHQSKDTLLLEIERARFVEQDKDSLNFWSGDNIRFYLTK